MTGYVYLIGPADGPVKIGRTDNPIVRLAALQTSHWQELEIVAVIGPIDQPEEIERTLHREFHQVRIRGEWFSRSDALFRRVNSLGAWYPRKKGSAA